MKFKLLITAILLVALIGCGGNSPTSGIVAPAPVQAHAVSRPNTTAQPLSLQASGQDACNPCPVEVSGGIKNVQYTFDAPLAIAPAAQTGPSGYRRANNPNHSIVNVVMTTGVQGDDNTPVDNVTTFDPNIQTLYAVVSTKNTAPGTVIKVRWIAANVTGDPPDSLIDSSEISVEGDVNIAFSLSRSGAQPWTPGAYRIQVYEDGELDGTLDFTIGGASSPSGSSRIARVVTFAEQDSAGNPIDLQGEFPAGTKTLAAQVFVNSDATIEVKGVWWTGVVPGWPSDTKLFEAVGRASNQQNGIEFNIERSSGEAFPPGTYKLELYVDDKLENTTAFRVGGSGASPAPSGGAAQFTYNRNLQVTPEWRVPAALVIAPNGDLYVTESGAVRRVAQNLSSTRFGETGISQGDGKLGPAVTGIAADSQSNIWVANPQHSNIQKFSADGKFLLRFPGDDSVTYDKDGEVNQAYGIAIDKQDNIYIADTLNNRIQKFDTNGKFVTKWTNLDLKAPIGIATDAQGNVYVTDTGNHRVVKFDPQGKMLLQFGKPGAGDGEFNGPWGIAVDAAGNIYVTDNFNQRVQVFNAQGKFLTQFGSKGAGEGQFDRPVGILVAPSGNVYVADGGNNTVQFFKPGKAAANPTPAPSSSGSGVAPGQGKIVADLGFRPNQDGFSFENYGGKYPNEQGDLFVEDMIRMFGEKAVCAGFKDGECQVAPGALEWADSANRGSNGGHCEGLAVLSLRLFVGKEASQQYGGARVYDLKFENQLLQRTIMYFFAAQMADPVYSAKKEGVSKTPSQVLDDIIAGIQKRDPTVVAIRHYEEDGSRVGHAVAPYAVEDMGNGLFYVWIYDNNAPGAERYIEVDRNANTWKYDVGSTNPSEPPQPWSGDADDHLFGAARISVRDGQMVCDWCADNAQANGDAMTRIALFGGGRMLVSNSDGENFGWSADGEFVTEIPGADVFFIDGGLGKPSIPVFYLPSDDTYDMQLDGSALTKVADSELFVFGGGRSLNIDNITLEPGETNILTLDGNLDAFSYDPEAAEDSLITLTFDGAENDYYFAFDGLDIDVGESLTFTFDETDGTLALDSDNGTEDDTYGLILKRVGDNGIETFENDEVAFGDEDTEYIEYGE